MRSLTVTLPDDMVEAIEARVAAGDYASESDVVRDSLEELLADSPDVEDWLRTVVVPRREKRGTDPAPLIAGEDVMSRIQHRFAAKHR